MKIYIIGSVSNQSKIEEAARKFEKTENEIRYVKKSSKPMAELIHDCFLHIDSWAELVMVVPKSVSPKLEIGIGTTYEMEHAKAMGKPVVIYY